MTRTVVELEGVNGEWFTLTGDEAGDQGIYLASDVKGLYDPPVKVVYEEPGDYPGSRFLNSRILRRDIVFAVHILNDEALGSSQSWMSRDSLWRKAWSTDRDSTLYVTTEESGTRALTVRLGEAIDVSLTTDPMLGTCNKAVMTVIAGDPFWYEDDNVFSVKTRLDTRFSPRNNADWDSQPKENLLIDVTSALNPTDQYIWLKWTVPGSTDSIPGLTYPFPADADIPWGNAPFSQFQIPDFSFEDPTQAARTIRTPGLVIGEDCVIDTDAREEQFSSASGSPVWARTNGVRFRYPVPPYTSAVKFPVVASGCAQGKLITLRCPRPWSRPWGLE